MVNRPMYFCTGPPSGFGLQLGWLWSSFAHCFARPLCCRVGGGEGREGGLLEAWHGGEQSPR